ncbi:MAG TPA: MerR family transcriptional regulator [Phycisphaerae bacterium]|nr:MerR family transcriptional regulator [Phycisphaerae bacterium]
MPTVKKKPADNHYFRISAAAEAAGVSKQTVEYYIMIGLLEPIRLPNRHGRFFNEKLVRRIKLIRRLNRLGYTLREIRRTYMRRLDRQAPGGK